MKRGVLRTAALMILLVIPAIASAKALAPLIVTGPDCPAGSARTVPWIMFEDRNGDGAYDFIIAGDCNGDVRGRPWQPNIQADPFVPTSADVPIGALPPGVVGISPELGFHEEASGLYSWTLVERTIEPGGGAEVCRIVRDADMGLSTTCDGRRMQ